MTHDLRSLAGLALFFFVAAGLALAPPNADAQTKTGSLTFVVTDTDGEPMSDVAITLEGEKIAGFQLRETNAAGRAFFSFLPPGVYLAEFTSSGYLPIRVDVQVGLGSALVERVTLSKGEMVETMTVRGQAPLDATDSGVNYTYDSETLANLQIGSGNRSYQSVLQQAAGVGGGSNPAVHGATLGENRYLIDGVDTTDPVTGTFGQNVNFDAMEAVEFQTGAWQAEYGQATGGIVNLVTKSGGNEFSGTFDVRYSDNGLVDSSALTLPDGSDVFDNSLDSKFRNIDLTFGGPIAKDKVWFFVAASDILSERQPPGGAAVRSYEGEFYLAKLTFQPNQNHRIAVQYTSDPAEISNVNSGTGVDSSAHYKQEQGSDFFTATYWGRLTDAWTMSIQAGYYESELNAFPQNDSGNPSRVNLINGYLSGNYVDAQFSDRIRTQIAASAEYRTQSERWHQIKFGFDFQDTSFEFNREQPGGAEEYVLGFDPADPYGTLEDPIRIDRLDPAPRSSNDATIFSAYIQDSWHVNDRLTLNYGVRWDQTKMTNDVGDEIAGFDLIQPRLGGTLDLTGDSRNLLTVHFGRFMDPGILAIANLVNENSDTTYIDLNEAVYGIDCNGSGAFEDMIVEDCFVFGGGGSQTDPDLKAMYVDEATIGYKRAIGDKQTFGARYIWRQTEDIIEDIEFPVDSGLYYSTNLPELIRRYNGVEFDYAFHGKRWHVMANYTLSWTKGNVEYTQHAGSDFDIFPDHYENRYGYLSTDRRHRVKIHGWVDLPRNFQIAWDYFYGSGLTYERLDTDTPIYGSIYVDPRGSNRLPSVQNLDVEARKSWHPGAGVELTLIASIENLLKENEVTSVNQTDGPSWAQPTGYQSPREYEFGFRVTW
jgi:outer membrane receptor protein involved in Fe transport